MNQSPGTGSSDRWHDAAPLTVTDGSPMIETATVSAPFDGIAALTLTGERRDDLNPLVEAELQVQSRTWDTRVIYAQNGLGPFTYKAYRLSWTASELSRYRASLADVVRVRPSPGPTAEYLLLFTTPVGIRLEGEERRVVRWAPETPARRARPTRPSCRRASTRFGRPPRPQCC